jgi:DNA primase
MNMPGVDFNLLRAEVSMEQVLNQLNFQPTSRWANQWHGPCPVHGSTSPGSRSFSVNLDTGRYFCHKCRSHGNALELWAAVHKLNIYEAALDLCRVLGRDVPWINRW